MSLRVQRSGSPGGAARKLGTAGQVRSPCPASADAPPAPPATHLGAAVLWAPPGPASRSRGLAARHRPALPMGALPARPLRPRLEVSPGAALRPRPPGSVCSRLPPPSPAPAPPPRAPPPPIGRCSDRPHPRALQPLSLASVWTVPAPRAPPTPIGPQDRPRLQRSAHAHWRASWPDSPLAVGRARASGDSERLVTERARPWPAGRSNGLRTAREPGRPRSDPCSPGVDSSAPQALTLPGPLRVATARRFPGDALDAKVQGAICARAGGVSVMLQWPLGCRERLLSVFRPCLSPRKPRLRLTAGAPWVGPYSEMHEEA